MCDSQETVTLGEELHTAAAGRGVHVVLEAVALGLSAGGVVGEVLTLPAWPGRLLFIIIDHHHHYYHHHLLEALGEGWPVVGLPLLAAAAPRAPRLRVQVEQLTPATRPL